MVHGSRLTLSRFATTGVQTERPHVSVKRYFEVSVQTDEVIDKSCKRLDLEAKSLTSTQADGASQTVHAQPSLDMSPIKQINRSDMPDKSISEQKNVSDVHGTIL